MRYLVLARCEDGAIREMARDAESASMAVLGAETDLMAYRGTGIESVLAVTDEAGVLVPSS